MKCILCQAKCEDECYETAEGDYICIHCMSAKVDHDYDAYKDSQLGL